MADLYAKCPCCGLVWMVAKLPMDLRKVADKAAKAKCANGCEDMAVMASEREYREQGNE